MTGAEKVRTIAILIVLSLLVWAYTRPKVIMSDPVIIERKVVSVDVQRIEELQDSIDFLKIELSQAKSQYYKIKRENEKIRIDVARMSDDELRGILTKRYTAAP